MELKVKDMSYGLLLSHTFPGLLFGFEILLSFELFTDLNLARKLCSFDGTIANLLMVLVFAFVLATVLGYILDGIHHFIFEDISKIEWHNREHFYRACSSVERMQIYKHFLEDDLWYPYEAYANIGIAMLPGTALLPFWLHRLGISLWFLFVLVVIYVAILIIMFYEAKTTLDIFLKEEADFIDNFRSDKSE